MCLIFNFYYCEEYTATCESLLGISNGSKPHTYINLKLFLCICVFVGCYHYVKRNGYLASNIEQTTDLVTIEPISDSYVDSKLK